MKTSELFLCKQISNWRGMVHTVARERGRRASCARLSSETAICAGALPLLIASRSVTVIGIVTITTAVPLGCGRVDLGDLIQPQSVRQKGEPTGCTQAGADKAVFALQMIEVVNAQKLALALVWNIAAI